MKIKLFPPLGFSQIGQRSNNEDCIYPKPAVATEQQLLFLVCDGVGGAATGEVASRIACETIAECLVGIEVLTEAMLNVVLHTVEDRITDYADLHPESAGMATTMTLFIIDQQGILLAHIGDSRIYHIRDEAIIYKSKDHSLVSEMVEAKVITPSQAINHPKRNVITRVLGMKSPAADLFRVKTLLAGDYFFLCTDGVLESVDETNLLTILNEEVLTNEQKMEIIRQKCEDKSRDNYSAYLLQIREIDKNWLETIGEVYTSIVQKVTSSTAALLNSPE